MNRQQLVLLSTAILLLAIAQPVLANSISPTVGFVPGFQPFGLTLALPMTVLAGILEGPFVARAGVREHARWYSLQANFVSLLLGYLMLPIAVPALYTIGILWSLPAICVSIVSEGYYYRLFVVPRDSRLKWRWVIIGNLFSNFVLLAIPVLASIAQHFWPYLLWDIEPYMGELTLVTVLGSLAAFGVSFLLPRLTAAKPGRGLQPKMADVSGSQLSGDPLGVQVIPALESPVHEQ
jgi:hypothetical protein